MIFTPKEVFEKEYASYSRLKSFDLCPHKFKLLYLDGLKGGDLNVSSVESQLGTLTHKIIEKYFISIQGIDNNYHPNPKYLLNNFSDIMKKLSDSREITRYFEEKDVYRYVDNFCKLFPVIDGRSVSEIETEKMIKINGIIYKGIIDLILVKENGKKTIIDFKTGSEKYIEDFQLKSYALSILGNSSYIHDDIKLIYVFLKTGKLKRFEINKSYCQEIVKVISKKINKILERKRFNPKVTHLCKWCEVRKYCSSFKKSKYAKYRFYT